MIESEKWSNLSSLFTQLNAEEEHRFSALACLSQEGIRRKQETRQGYRQPFAQDADRILHSKAYTRYIDKTQVFSLIDNDHITHRVLHVQMVSRIGRTVGRFLGLNEDLIEAIALGHDIGHPPFGHEGERILDRLCKAHGLSGFQHNIQSVQFLDRFEKKGRGWNLTLQVLNGILCHDGEAHAGLLTPDQTGEKSFAAFDRLLSSRETEAGRFKKIPMTYEGCVVRLCDSIAYIGRDIEDAIELGLIERSEIPEQCGRVLGTSNGTIVHSLVTDLISNSVAVRSSRAGRNGQEQVGFSRETASQLAVLKAFNYQRIYRNPLFKPDFKRIHSCYEQLFDWYLTRINSSGQSVDREQLFLRSMSEEYLHNHPPAAIVRDYLAGMTDDFFLRQAEQLGCDIPERTCVVN